MNCNTAPSTRNVDNEFQAYINKKKHSIELKLEHINRKVRNRYRFAADSSVLFVNRTSMSKR